MHIVKNDRMKEKIIDPYLHCFTLNTDSYIYVYSTQSTVLVKN